MGQVLPKTQFRWQKEHNKGMNIDKYGDITGGDYESPGNYIRIFSDDDFDVGEYILKPGRSWKRSPL